MSMREILARLLGTENYDRRAERRIKKAMELYHRGGKLNRIRALRLHNRNRRDYCCCFPPRITVGKGLYIAHAHGIHVGKTAEIGDWCRIYPNAMIVASVVGDSELRAAGEKRWHPKIGSNCLIGAGCIIAGRIELGDDVTVAAGAVVTKDVPSHSVVKNTNEIRPKRPEEYNDFSTDPSPEES